MLNQITHLPFSFLKSDLFWVALVPLLTMPIHPLSAAIQLFRICFAIVLLTLHLKARNESFDQATSRSRMLYFVYMLVISNDVFSASAVFIGLSDSLANNALLAVISATAVSTLFSSSGSATRLSYRVIGATIMAFSILGSLAMRQWFQTHPSAANDFVRLVVVGTSVMLAILLSLSADGSEPKAIRVARVCAIFVSICLAGYAVIAHIG